ncbi:transaldolase family protein [Chloroflexota bacterium]
MTKLHELAQLGQSIWYDNIRRALLDSGELQALVEAGVVGVTSNPSIFEKAIAGSSDYDGALADLVTEGKSAEQIYEALALEDIRRAADLLRPVYDRTGGVDGYVSLEVSPTLAHDTEGTVADARRLFAALDRPNIMIKVPATPAGIPATETRGEAASPLRDSPRPPRAHTARPGGGPAARAQTDIPQQPAQPHCPIFREHRPFHPLQPPCSG